MTNEHDDLGSRNQSSGFEVSPGFEANAGSLLTERGPDDSAHERTAGGCECERCTLWVDQASINVKAFEVTGELVCADCADEAFEDHSQFGVGA